MAYNPLTGAYTPDPVVSKQEADNIAARKATEAWASPFSTAFGGSAPSTNLDYTRTYASPFDTSFGGQDPATTKPVVPVVPETTGQTGATKFRASDGREFDTAAERDVYQAKLDAATKDTKDKYDKEQAALALKAQQEAAKADAFALIEDTMKSYGFTAAEMGELSGYLQKAIIDPNVGPNGAILGMKQLAVYKQRFAGNETRVAAGQNALSEYDYLQQENAYSEYLKAYGVQDLGTRETYATLIGNSVSGTEVQKRVGMAVDRVKNSDPQIMGQLKTYYPSLTDADLVSYFLNPKQALPDLQRKVTASEIGAAAIGQGFAGATDALGLADYGVDRAKALTGYQDIKAVLPVSQKLGDIYNEANIKYNQTTGEQEFLKDSADAAEKRRQLKSLERAKFSGDTGLSATGGVSLGKTSYGKF